MSLYTDLIAAGIPTSNHESDLYFPVTKESTAILKKHCPDGTAHVTRFTNQVVGGIWYDVFGAFDPYWESKKK